MGWRIIRDHAQCSVRLRAASRPSSPHVLWLREQPGLACSPLVPRVAVFSASQARCHLFVARRAEGGQNSSKWHGGDGDGHALRSSSFLNLIKSS